MIERLTAEQFVEKFRPYSNGNGFRDVTLLNYMVKAPFSKNVNYVPRIVVPAKANDEEYLTALKNSKSVEIFTDKSAVVYETLNGDFWWLQSSFI